MSEKDKSKTNTQTKSIPKDAQVIISLMKEVGITDYEPAVVNQFLEIAYTHVTSVLEDARAIAKHSNKKQIDVEDIRLANQMRCNRITTPLPREEMLVIARQQNAKPLPPIKPCCGLRLPPDRYCLTACNYQMKSATKKVATETIALPIETGTSPKTTSSQSKMVKEPRKAIVNAARVKPSVPRPVVKYTSGSSVYPKSKAAHMTAVAGPSRIPDKMQIDDPIGAQKRKREDDDHDM